MARPAEAGEAAKLTEIKTNRASIAGEANEVLTESHISVEIPKLQSRYLPATSRWSQSFRRLMFLACRAGISMSMSERRQRYYSFAIRHSKWWSNGFDAKRCRPSLFLMASRRCMANIPRFQAAGAAAKVGVSATIDRCAKGRHHYSSPRRRGERRGVRAVDPLPGISMQPFGFDCDRRSIKRFDSMQNKVHG